MSRLPQTGQNWLGYSGCFGDTARPGSGEGSRSGSGADSALRIVLRNEGAQTLIGALQDIFTRQEDNAQVARARSLSEAGAVYRHDLFFHQQLLHELLVAPRDVKLRERVEGAARSDAAH